MTNSLTVVAKVFSNTLRFLLQHIFQQKNVNVFALFQDRNFNVTPANKMVSFKLLSPRSIADIRPSINEIYEGIQEI